MDMEAEIRALKAKIEALEARTPEAPSHEAISAALDAHPDIGRFRAFLDKWGNRPA